MTYHIVPYNNQSRGAKALAEALDVKAPAKLGGSYTAATFPAQYYINWGNAGGFSASKILNAPKAVAIARHKVKTFDACKDVCNVPKYTVQLDEALAWVEEGREVLGRDYTGSCGDDISFIQEDRDGWMESEFWVEYIKKDDEYRVHVMADDLILIQKKVARKRDVDGNAIDLSQVDFRIRNHDNGFIFIREGFTCPERVVDCAKAAVKALGLDFGAVDVMNLWRDEKKAYLLEVNTAPGLVGTTPMDYANAFKRNFPLDNAA